MTPGFIARFAIILPTIRPVPFKMVDLFFFFKEHDRNTMSHLRALRGHLDDL